MVVDGVPAAAIDGDTQQGEAIERTAVERQRPRHVPLHPVACSLLGVCGTAEVEVDQLPIGIVLEELAGTGLGLDKPQMQRIARRDHLAERQLECPRVDVPGDLDALADVVARVGRIEHLGEPDAELPQG